MESAALDETIATAQVVDACMRLKLEYKIAPAGIRQIAGNSKPIYGKCLPVRHFGSVDVFLEKFERGNCDGILIIDNGGRLDEACIGDLVVLEAKQAGIQAIAVWGLHRDTSDLVEINLPVWSYGSFPSGPARLDTRDAAALQSARFGSFLVTADDAVFLDLDGIVFVNASHVEQILSTAQSIRQNERRQAKLARQGKTMRQQFEFTDYLKRRDLDETYSFRTHLSSLSKSIEE